jgi:hypothetical protein
VIYELTHKKLTSNSEFEQKIQTIVAACSYTTGAIFAQRLVTKVLRVMKVFTYRFNVLRTPVTDRKLKAVPKTFHLYR